MARSRNFQNADRNRLPQKGRVKDALRRTLQAAQDVEEDLDGPMTVGDEINMDSDWEHDRQNGNNEPDSFYDNLLSV